MADWNVDLPGPAEEGAPTHIEDHDSIVAAITEARSVIDAAQATIASLQGLIDGKAETGHTHDAGDINAGTLAAGRIPAIAQSKVTGLAGALDAKADADALAALEGRVDALEADPEPEA